MSSTIATLLDVRDITLCDRHALIFDRFDALGVGEALELVSDRVPLPLRLRFQNRAAGRFDWRYLEIGPPFWRVRITRMQPADA